MQRLFIGAILLGLTSCSMSTYYPTMGAVVGGGAGALAGPGGAALGAGAGAIVGELAQGEEKVQEQATIIKALSTGDVQKLVDNEMKKSEGKVSEMLDGLWAFLRWCLIGVILWNVVPLLYTMYVHRKHKEKNEKSD